MKNIIILFALLSLSCCDISKPMKKVKSARNIRLIKVEATPTLPDQQNPDKKYILDYEISREIDLTFAEKRDLKKELTNKENYTTENTKKCPFMAQYIVSVDEQHFMVLSLSPCGKVIISDRKTALEERFELTDGNSLEKIIQNIDK